MSALLHPVCLRGSTVGHRVAGGGCLLLAALGLVHSAAAPLRAAQPPSTESSAAPSSPSQSSVNPVSLRVPAEWLTDVRPVTTDLGLQAADREPYLQIIRWAADLPAEQVRTAAQAFLAARSATVNWPASAGRPLPLFVDLFRHPDVYQGQAVELRGHVQRVVETHYEAADGTTQASYELWLYTDGSLSNPFVILTHSIPPGLRQTDDVQSGVEVLGFFYRLYTYRASDGHRRAPLVFAAQVTAPPPVDLQLEAKPTGLTPPVVALLLLAGGAIVVTVVILAGSSGRRRNLPGAAQRLDTNLSPPLTTGPDFMVGQPIAADDVDLTALFADNQPEERPVAPLPPPADKPPQPESRSEP